jgi:hypothetical protein
MRAQGSHQCVRKAATDRTSIVPFTSPISRCEKSRTSDGLCPGRAQVHAGMRPCTPSCKTCCSTNDASPCRIVLHNDRRLGTVSSHPSHDVAHTCARLRRVSTWKMAARRYRSISAIGNRVTDVTCRTSVGSAPRRVWWWPGAENPFPDSVVAHNCSQAASRRLLQRLARSNRRCRPIRMVFGSVRQL